VTARSPLRPSSDTSTWQPQSLGEHDKSRWLLLWEMMMDIDGSFELDVERTGWDDIALVLPRHDLRINLDPVEAARICRDIWAALGREQPAANSHAA